MRTRGTKEIVATSDGRGFIALLENGELWRFNSMVNTWVRVLTPEEMDTREKITPRTEAERLAEEDQRYATISVLEADRLDTVALAQRLAGGVFRTEEILKLARWVIAKFDKGGK